jgi:RNA polymerase sigma-70 factor (ECF subfamily)
MATDDWQVWFDRHGAALVLFARQWVVDFADAEDVVQEAFVRFWRSRPQARDPAAYLYACARRCALDWQRSRERRSRREKAVVRPEAQTLFAGPPEEDERCAVISAALQNLPENQREIVVMKIWGGLSFPQIADVLRIPANTAASRYRYALAKLREPLAKEATP